MKILRDGSPYKNPVRTLDFLPCGRSMRISISRNAFLNKTLLTASIVLSLFLLAFFPGGLARKVSQIESANAEPAPTLLDEQKKKTEISKADAARLADQHLTLRNARWGKETDIKEEDEEYIVFYETPANELRLIGQRAVTVRKSSGLARVRPRR